MSPGTALRELQQAQAGMRKARELLKQARENPRVLDAAFDAGWAESGPGAPADGGDPARRRSTTVLTKQLAVGRYATALLVRLRRLKRHDAAGSAEIADDDDGFGNEDSED